MTRIASCGSMKHRGMAGRYDGDRTAPRAIPQTAHATRTAAARRVAAATSLVLFRTMELFRTSLPDQVFHRLASDVLAGRYAPGERLPTQRALAADLGVNMASVREGVKRLEQLGLVEVRHGDAMRVRDWRLYGGPDVLVHLIARAGALDVDMARAVMEARRLLLSESARLAASRRSDEQAALLTSLAEQIAGAPGDEAAQHLDFAFFAV